MSKRFSLLYAEATGLDLPITQPSVCCKDISLPQRLFHAENLQAIIITVQMYIEHSI
jgi:hypothetical protein